MQSLTVRRTLTLLLKTVLVLLLAAFLIRAVPYYFDKFTSAARFGNTWFAFEDNSKVIVGNALGQKKIIGSLYEEYPTYALNNQGELAALSKSKRALVLINIHTGEVKTIKKLTPEEKAPWDQGNPYQQIIYDMTWSPDNTKLSYFLYNNTPNNLVILNVKDGTEAARFSLEDGVKRLAWLSDDQLLLLLTRDGEHMPSDVLLKIESVVAKRMTKLCEGHVNFKEDVDRVRGYKELAIQRASIPTSDCMKPYLADIEKIIGSFKYPVYFGSITRTKDGRYYSYQTSKSCLLLPYPDCERKIVEAVDTRTGRRHTAVNIATYITGP